MHEFRDRAGRTYRLRIEVPGRLHPQTVTWKPELRDEITIADIMAGTEAGVRALRAEGADLIITLSHSGIGRFRWASLAGPFDRRTASQRRPERAGTFHRYRAGTAGTWAVCRPLPVLEPTLRAPDSRCGCRRLA